MKDCFLQKIQGIYVIDYTPYPYKSLKGVYYITYCELDNLWYHQKCKMGEKIEYTNKRRFNIESTMANSLKLVEDVWLPNNTVISDSYPELFI